MKHYRPIKTFATWLLHHIYLEQPHLGRGMWGGKEHERWIKDNLGLDRATHGDTRADIFIHHHRGFPVEGKPHMHIFNFPTFDQAMAFQKQWGGEYHLESMKDTSRRNEGIEGNFTLDDLKYLYGDPLPNVIQYHILYMEDRGGYFRDFSFMHQEWSRSWIPSAFIYRKYHYREEEVEVICWFADALAHQITQSDEHGWQRGWKHYGSGVFEFDDIHLAKLFMLRFGADELPSSYRPRSDATILASQFSDILSQVGTDRIWEKKANIPDYRNPRELD